MAKSPPKVKSRLKPASSSLDADSQALGEFRHLWHEYGKSAVSGLALGVAIVVGWQGWDYYRGQHAVEAAESYLAFIGQLEAVDGPAADAADTEDEAAAAVAAAVSGVVLPSLPDESYNDTPYPAFARLQRARYFVKHDRLDEAAEDLYWVGENANQPMLSQLAYFRLVRVLIASGKTEEALEVLDETEFATAMTPLIEEARGDALLKNEDTGGAIDAYKRAWEAHARKPDFLRMKLEALGQNVAARQPQRAAQ